MKLSAKQAEFTKSIGLLINYATAKGYSLTFADAYRDPRLHGEFGEKKAYGSANSVHKLRLAVDFNLFIGGEYISDSRHKAWSDLGEFWKSLHPFARWGGDFKLVDSVHFSFEHVGHM